MRQFFIRLATLVGTVGLIGFAMPRLFPEIEAAASICLAGILWLRNITVDFGSTLYTLIQWLGGDGVSVIVAGLLAFAGIPWTLKNNARLQREAIQQQYENQAKLESIRFVMERRSQIIELIDTISDVRGEVRSLTVQIRNYCKEPTHHQFIIICRSDMWNRGNQADFVKKASDFAFHVNVPARTIVLTTLTAEVFLSTTVDEIKGNSLPSIDKVTKLGYYVQKIDETCERTIDSLYETLRIADFVHPQKTEGVTGSHCQ